VTGVLTGALPIFFFFFFLRNNIYILFIVLNESEDYHLSPQHRPGLLFQLSNVCYFQAAHQRIRED